MTTCVVSYVVHLFTTLLFRGKKFPQEQLTRELTEPRAVPQTHWYGMPRSPFLYPLSSVNPLLSDVRVTV